LDYGKDYEKRYSIKRADIDDLMNRFYARAMSDDVIGLFSPMSSDWIWTRHLPIIGDFWETLLFGTRNYQKHGRNPMQIHALLNLKTPLRKRTFSPLAGDFSGNG
jgi:hemoglobin